MCFGARTVSPYPWICVLRLFSLFICFRLCTEYPHTVQPCVSFVFVGRICSGNCFSVFSLRQSSYFPVSMHPCPQARLPAAPSGIALLLSMRRITLRKVYHSILSDEQLFSLIREYYTTYESILQSYYRIFFTFPDSFLGKTADFMNIL